MDDRHEGGGRGAPGSPLEVALRARVARASERAETVRADLVFEAHEGEAWTVRLREGRASLLPGKVWFADATITADATTLTEVVDGVTVGVDAFLRGRLFLRGNIALPLELDDLLHPRQRDPRAPRARRVDVDGVHTFYLEAGDEAAPPVVLLHGLGATSSSFLTTLWDLSRDHRVIALDLPGFGESGKPLRPLRPAFFARHVIGLLDAIGVQRAHVVGNSMGGRVALEVGLRFPERVDRLVLLAPSMAFRRFRFGIGLVRLVRHELAFLPLPAMHAVVVRLLRSMFAVPERVPMAAMNAAADEFLRVYGTARGRVAFFNAMREIYLEDAHGERGFWDRLPRLSRPSLFLFGDRDWLVPAGFARFVSQAVPSARCEIIGGCGHVPQFEIPERTHALIRGFFAGDG